MVGHIAGINLLGLLAALPDPVNGLEHGHVLMEVQKLRRHNAAGGILRVFEKLIDERSGLRLGIFQHALDHHGRHFLQHIYRIVHEQILDDGAQLLVGDGGDDVLLGLRLQLGKYVAGLILGQGPKAGDLLQRRQLLHEFGHVHLVGVCNDLVELCKLLMLQQFVEFLNELLSI